MAHTARLESLKSQKRIDNANPALMLPPVASRAVGNGQGIAGKVSARCARRMEGAAQPA